MSLIRRFHCVIKCKSLFGGEVWHLFIFIRLLYVPELPVKCPREKILNPQNTNEKKCWKNEIPTRKHLGSTKCPREKVSDPRNTHERKFWTYKIPTRKNFGLTMTRWHKTLETHDGTRLTEFSTRHIYRAFIVCILKKVFFQTYV